MDGNNNDFKPRENEGKHVGNRHRRFRALPFFITMAVITVIAWLLPLRPTISEAEKRELATFPKFSFSSLFDGSYFSGIDSWFSDTFTFRDTWIDKAQDFKDMYGVQTVAIYGETAVSDAVPVPKSSGYTPKAETLPIETEAPMEQVQAEPAASAIPEPQNEVAEEEVFPEEAETLSEEVSAAWGGVEIDDDEFVGVGQVLQIGDAAYKITVFVKYHADRFVELMGDAADRIVIFKIEGDDPGARPVEESADDILFRIIKTVRDG